MQNALCFYRLLPYCDDFKLWSITFPKGSVGGRVQDPNGSVDETRKKQPISTDSLFDTERVSRNHIIDAIIDGIKLAFANGVLTTDSNGNACVIFF